MKSLSVIVRNHFIGNNWQIGTDWAELLKEDVDHVAPSVSNLQRSPANNRKMLAKRRDVL